MNRSTSRTLALAVVFLIGGLFVGGVLLLSFGLRRALQPTTADPGALGLVASKSLKPVTLGLHAKHERLAESEKDYGEHRFFNAVDRQISFTLPAAYITIIDLKDGPEGAQRLGFELWSRSFDPVMPDRLAARRACGHDLCQEGPFAERRASGEDNISVEVTSVIGTPAYRHYVLGFQSGLEPSIAFDGRGPCAIGYDAARDLVTLDKPADMKRSDEACNFLGNGRVTRDGVRAVPRHFAKRNVDGSLRYVVRCSNFSDDPRAESLCEMWGYFGIWPLRLLVRPSRIDTWDDLYTRVNAFLADHIAQRTDRTGAE